MVENMIEIDTEAPVVALERLLEVLAVRGHRLLVGEGVAVEASQHLVARRRLRSRRPRSLNTAYPLPDDPRARHVRALAQIDELAAA